jgi:hypothetical protein
MDAATTQVVQQVHPSWFDWNTVAALVIGPMLALFAQRLLDHIREKRKQRVQLYLTVMSLRASWLHFDSMRALNSIDTIFDRASDQEVRSAWRSVIAHGTTKRPDGTEFEEEAKAWDDRLVDLRVDLYQLLGKAVGYNHTIDYIKTQIYAPQYHIDAEIEAMMIRKQFAKAITEDGLKVIVSP